MGIPQAAARQSCMELVRVLRTGWPTEKLFCRYLRRQGFSVRAQRFPSRAEVSNSTLAGPMKCEVLNIRPEFLKKVTGQPAREAINRPDNRIVRIGLTVDAPRVGQKIVPRDGHITRIRGREVPITPASDECKLNRITQPSLKRF